MAQLKRIRRIFDLGAVQFNPASPQSPMSRSSGRTTVSMSGRSKATEKNRPAQLHLKGHHCPTRFVPIAFGSERIVPQQSPYQWDGELWG